MEFRDQIKTFILYISATVYGKGVYFARDASYSVTSNFCPPDANGLSYIYYGQVLTGEYILGNKTMIMPPSKDPNNPVIHYDSTVDNQNNPTKFAIYYDNQAYPQYLVTFQL